ncbi:MFS transporter [Actinoplanes utahensis]|uniref:Major facilitator superfamily (MFS) profile domain-containing protein n=1 Tax=Actinoplanes utahensis TaxID=1869 RepID=A0A0A6UGF8_ACTUT|nr:MFS transporter [Actinoplanes utahensis]KHD75135.1 hypothetical protein MB27_24790 [Actinoplanes utahensis]GIF27085.1 hypothetical protein Aut01nite_00710 [Actinoplanes utahensis]
MTSVRERRALSAAVLLSGSGEVLDFLLPLFASAALDASPATTGALLAAELAVSLLARPLAGVLADRFERRTLAACGALLYAVACTGYALAGALPPAFAAAVVSGVGGALLWVPLRALVGERLAEDSGVFARLVAAEETGGWAVFVPAVLIVGPLGYGGTFLALAACCLAAALILALTPRRAGRSPAATAGRSPAATAGRSPAAATGRSPAATAGRPLPVRRLTPMLFAVATTMVAESAIGVLLLLHLQREFGMEPLEVAAVFLPGAIAMSILPPYLHRLVVRYGRTRMLAIASVASASFAAALATAPNPTAIAICWVAAAAAWSVVLPVQQAVIAEASGPAGLGRGLGWYESATLAGALVGSLSAGLLYQTGSWPTACLVFAAVILAGAVTVPAAIRHLGLPSPTSHSAAIASAIASPTIASPTIASLTKAGPDAPARQDLTEPDAEPTSVKSRRRLLTDLLAHAGLFAVALLAARTFIDDLPVAGILGVATAGEGPTGLAGGLLRTWWIILVIDIVWTLGKVARPARRQRTREPR